MLKGYTRRSSDLYIRGKVAQGLFEEGRGRQRVVLGGEVIYTEGKRLLKGNSKRGEVAEWLY